MNVKASGKCAIWAALIVAIIAGGCTRRDEPADNKLWGGYAKGQELVLRHDCFLAKVSDGIAGARFALLPPGEFWDPSQIHSSPRSVVEWRKAGTNAHPDVVGVVPGGTVVKCSRLRTDRGWHWFVGAYSVATVFASICDGEYAGTEVDMTDMSVFGPIERTPNPVLLKPKLSPGEAFGDSFTNQVPFTRVVSDNERPADSLCGTYTDDNPDVGGLSGRRLYLYPDRAFVLTRWADILPEAPILKGTWTRTDSSLTLVPQPATNLPWLDLSYTTVLFDDGRKQSLLLVGAEWGEKGFRDFVDHHEEALARARSVYVANADRSTNFVFQTWEDEIMYVMTFSAGFAFKRPLAEQDSRWLTAEPLP